MRRGLIAVSMTVVIAGPAFFAAGASTTTAAAAPNTQGAPAAAGSVVASQVGISPDLSVAWTPGAGPLPTGATVLLWSQTSQGSWQYLTDTTCTAGCRSVTFRYLQFARNYAAAVWVSNASGTAAGVGSSPVFLQNTCGAGLCINVDTSQPVQAAAGQDSGILHSVYSNPTEDSRLAQIGASMWRSSWYGDPGNNVPRWSVVQNQHVPTTFILSDKWWQDTNDGTATPWDNWDTYRNWVVASIQQVLGSGLKVDYWEVYNEPDHMTTDYYPGAQAASVTPDRLLTQFLVSYNAIKSVLPNANIIGPSMSVWAENPTSNSFSMPQFLNYAATNQLSLSAVSWHLNGGAPQNIQDQVGEARALISSLPSLGSPKIFINEFEPEALQRIPGWDVEYLAALTNARVDSAGRSCWAGDCWQPVLDGLLASDGSSTLPDFWVRAAYGQMSGTMVAASATSDSAGVLASLNSAGSQVSVLLGYGVGCVQDPRCAAVAPTAYLAAPLPTQLTVKVPWTTGHVAVSETRIPGASISPMASPASQAMGTFPIVSTSAGAEVNVSVGSLADGDAWSVTLTHTS